MTGFVEILGARRPIGLKPADTNEATLYTAAKENPTMLKLHVANLTATPANATVKWGDGTTDYSIIDTFAVPARGYLVEDLVIPMKDGYTIKVTSGTANALTFTIIISEYGGVLGGEHAP